MKRTVRLSVLLVLLLLALLLCACTGRVGEECRHENLNIVTEEISPSSCTVGGAYFEKGICTACGEIAYLKNCESAPTGHRFNEYPYCIDCGFIRGSEGIEYARDGAAPRYVVVSSAGCTDEVIYIAEEIDGYPVEIIGTEAFSGNTRVTKIVIPKTVRSIGTRAFSNCTSLKSVNIPDGIEAIDDSAFSGCTSLEFTERDGIYYIGGNDNPYAYLSHLADKEITECNIALGVRYISRAAFRGCVNIEKIVIPEGVGVIGDGTFSGLTSLRELSVPSTVYSVGKYAIEGCKSLSLYSFGGAYYLGNEKNPTVALISIIDSSATACEISPTAKCIGQGAFETSSIESIVIPDSVTSIGDGAFEGCASLESVKLGNGIINIGSYAFSGCSRLRSVELPSGEVFVCSYAFAECVALGEITIHKSTYYIASGVLDGCTALEKIKFVGTEDEFSRIAIERQDGANEIFFTAEKEYLKQ